MMVVNKITDKAKRHTKVSGEAIIARWQEKCMRVVESLDALGFVGQHVLLLLIREHSTRAKDKSSSYLAKELSLVAGQSLFLRGWNN
jgi:hypothetical protein